MASFKFLSAALLAGALLLGPSAALADDKYDRDRWGGGPSYSESEKDRRKAQKEWDKDRREAMRERVKHRREAARERDKDRREWEKDRRESAREARKARR